MPESGWLARFALDTRPKRAWALYDWANSAFWVVVITAVFPTYYSRVAAELGTARAEARFSMATAGALAVIAVLAPVLGTLADIRAWKKRLLGLFALGGACACCGLFFVDPGEWALGLVLFGLANIGASGSIVFYDALLPHVAKKEEVDRLSASGFALGYLGGGLLLGLVVLWISKPGWFGFPTGDGLSEEDSTLPVRAAFLAVGLWWLLFTIPLLRNVPEPYGQSLSPGCEGRAVLGAAVTQLCTTFKEMRRYRQAFLFLLAFLIYNDGILTIIRMASLYASSRNLDSLVVIATILGIQFVGIPFSIAFGQLAGRWGAKRMILIGLAVYAGITVQALFLDSAIEFVILGLLIGTVQGGTQALGRSLFASLIPAAKSGEFFAFFSVGEKFAGILGPALYSLMIVLTGSNRWAIGSIIGFFVIGGVLLARVDIQAGRQAVLNAQEV